MRLLLLTHNKYKVERQRENLMAGLPKSKKKCMKFPHNNKSELLE